MNTEFLDFLAKYAINMKAAQFPVLTKNRREKKTTDMEIVMLGDSHGWGQGSPGYDITLPVYSTHMAKKHMDYPFTNTYTCDHLYKGLLLQNKLDTWEQFLILTKRFKSNRSNPFKKQSEHFENLMKSQIKGIPGFVTNRTLQEISEYYETIRMEDRRD